MHRAAKLGRTSLISDGFKRHPQTLSSPPPQGQVFAGTKDSRPRVSPVRHLRPLNVSRVKCGGGPCRGHALLPCTKHTICLRCALKKCGRFDISLPETREAAPGPAAIHSGRIPPHGHLQPGTEDSDIPLTTPDMARSGRVLHSQSNLISKVHKPRNNKSINQIDKPGATNDTQKSARGGG